MVETSAESDDGALRIFWLGMHKILVETEFRLLQDMGYKVFRPPYLSSVQDQSTSTSLDFGNAVLPSDVHDRLSSYNFFYNSIAPDVAELVNEHFDVVMVTINPDWLKSVLQVFEGKVLYRCYGQLGTVAESLAYNGSQRLIQERSAEFHFLPHAPECLRDEASWLADVASVVPYWLPDDVFEREGAWRAIDAKRPSIALSCPNISNPYYNHHFRYLKRFFEERCFRYYGVQLEPNADPNVVGTLPRSEQLALFAQEAGYLYTYREPNVCYLPPIEMMVMGGPVLYFPESLLGRYFEGRSPGAVKDEADAVRRSKWLIKGDSSFASEIISSQASVAHRYTRSFGEGVFRAALSRLLTPRSREADVLPAPGPGTAVKVRRVLLFAHLGGYVERDGEFASIHGIPRVMRKFVRALNDDAVPVTVTSNVGDREPLLGFFRAECKYPHLVDTIDAAEAVSVADAPGSDYAYAIVPHYHAFPEANSLSLPILAYIPDYLPHFFRGRGWFDEPADAIECGRRLAAVARRILTNSLTSREYLPASRLEVPAERLINFPLPFLGSQKAMRSDALDPQLQSLLSASTYIFYPTQPHPHKRLDLLLMAWIVVNRGRTDPIRLVLTSGVLPAELRRLVDQSALGAYVHLLPALSDRGVEWLYSRAACLAFSSEMEGNFPTQVLEAMHLDCPIVCFDMPLLTAELRDLRLHLEMVPFGDVEAFASAVERAIWFRQPVLDRQSLVKQQLADAFSFDRFRGNVIDLHRSMISEDSK